MTVLIVIASILLLLFLLLLMPVRLCVQYRQGNLVLKAGYLFLHYDLSPEAIARRTEKQAARDAKKEYKAQTAHAKTKAEKEKGALDTLRTIWSLLKASGKALGLIRRNLVIYRLRLLITVARDDAHQTAIAYGLASSAVAVLLSVLDELFVLRPGTVHVSPDFTHPNSRLDLQVRLRVQPLILLIAGLRLAFAYVGILNENKQKRQRVKHSSKGGHVHESAASHR